MKFLPTLAITREHQLRCAFSVDDHPPRIENLEHGETFHNHHSCKWTTTLVSEASLDGYVAKDFTIRVADDRTATIRIALLDPGLIFYRAELYKPRD